MHVAEGLNWELSWQFILLIVSFLIQTINTYLKEKLHES